MTGDSRKGGLRRPQNRQSPPFSIRLLERAADHGDDASRDLNEDLSSGLPASYRTESDDLAAPACHITACIDKELDLRRLTRIHGWLWAVGRPMPPRPLHYQLLLRREILVAEQMDMHLVWTTGRIFVKPVPRFLLDSRFWTEYLCCAQGCNCSVDDDGCPLQCERRGLRGRALGFLFSYAALISYESDFRIAEEKHLLPQGLQWPAWRTFVKQLDTEHIYPDIDPRFYYGELRLSRLNKIYFLRTLYRGYMSRWNQYGSFFGDNLAWLAGATVYIAIVLTAMQVGLATNTLKNNNAFQSASYGFTVFSTLGPLICVSLIVLVFFLMCPINWCVTLKYSKKRVQLQGLHK
ncbi:subtilisin-like serine protease [Achaetomium macrosporum]|uniref:Subtilisin-like serine protease n=1 Tax=Achaetomium macrosporum TaxID=79813 RepID=A0AAN7C1A3_9PEZI|nr:subtilisin-like serine protease [Achaetomium macrosporum]